MGKKVFHKSSIIEDSDVIFIEGVDDDLNLVETVKKYEAAKNVGKLKKQVETDSNEVGDDVMEIVVDQKIVEKKSPKKPAVSRQKTAGVVEKKVMVEICPFCEKVFKDSDCWAQRDTHVRADHAEKYENWRRELDISSVHFCSDCGFKFPTNELFFDHYTFCSDYKISTEVSSTRRSSRRSAVVKNYAEPPSRIKEEEEVENDVDFEVEEEAESDYHDDETFSTKSATKSPKKSNPIFQPTNSVKQVSIVFSIFKSFNFIFSTSTISVLSVLAALRIDLKKSLSIWAKSINMLISFIAKKCSQYTESCSKSVQVKPSLKLTLIHIFTFRL